MISTPHNLERTSNDYEWLGATRSCTVSWTEICHFSLRIVHLAENPWPSSVRAVIGLAELVKSVGEVYKPGCLDWSLFRQSLFILWSYACGTALAETHMGIPERVRCKPRMCAGNP